MYSVLPEFINMNYPCKFSRRKLAHSFTLSSPRSCRMTDINGGEHVFKEGLSVYIRGTNKQTRRVQRVFSPPEPANELKTFHDGDPPPPIMGFIPDCPSHLSLHNLLFSKSRYSYPSLKSFPDLGIDPKNKLEALSHELDLGRPKGAET